MAVLTRAWHKTGHTGRDGGLPTVRPANGTEWIFAGRAISVPLARGYPTRNRTEWRVLMVWRMGQEPANGMPPGGRLRVELTYREGLTPRSRG
jgi:hypothetical protein